MIIYSIIKGKMTEASPDDYFFACDPQTAKDTIKAFSEAGFFLIEEKKIVNRDETLEQKIYNSYIASCEERGYLEEYYKRQ